MLKQSADFSRIFNNIIALCSKKNITVSNLVGRFSTSKSAMPAWKKGNISPDTLMELSKYFGVSIESIITGIEPEPELTGNEREMLTVFRKFDEREQLKVIGRMEEIYDEKKRAERIGVQVARTTDGVPVRQDITPEILETINNLPEDTDY